MKRAHKDYLQDMLDNAEKALDFVGSMELDQFFQDEKTSYAVVRALEIIVRPRARFQKMYAPIFPNYNGGKFLVCATN